MGRRATEEVEKKYRKRLKNSAVPLPEHYYYTNTKNEWARVDWGANC